jgi:hypothetical protein
MTQPQVDGDDAVERLLGDLGRRRVAARNAQAHVVMQHVDAAELFPRGADHGGERVLPGDVGLERHAGTVLPGHRRGLFRQGEIAVRRHHGGTLLDEAQHRGAPIAHALAGRLARTDDDGDLVLQAHGVTLSIRPSGPPRA